MSARKSKVVKVNISAGTYKDETEAVREANAIKRWLIRHCEKNGYSVKGRVWISTNSAYAGRVIKKGRKKEYKPNGKPLPMVVEAHIHMVLFCNPASTIVADLKDYLNKKHMKAVVWDKHCNSRAEVENAVEYAMRQSRKVRTIDYDRKDVLSVDVWGYYEAVEKAEAKIKDNMAFTKSEPEQTPETLENKSVSSISNTPETLTYKTIKHNYLYYYIVSTSYNHSIIKPLLQKIIYYSRDSSRSSCSKNIFKKGLLKVPHLLKNIKLCVIISVYDTGNVLDFTENNVRNRRIPMKKVLSFLLTISLVFVLCSCQQGADTNTIKYHSNKTINKLINNFNEILVEGEEIQITQDMVRKGAYDFNANISINDVWITVYDSSNGLFVDYQLESTDDTPISPLFYRFVKATNSDITDDEIALAWSELQTNKYQNYSYYKFDKFECTYAKQQLVNGEYRYTIKTGYKN